MFRNRISVRNRKSSITMRFVPLFRLEAHFLEGAEVNNEIVNTSDASARLVLAQDAATVFGETLQRGRFQDSQFRSRDCSQFCLHSDGQSDIAAGNVAGLEAVDNGYVVTLQNSQDDLLQG